MDTIARELGWRALPDRDEHVDCNVDPVAHHLRQLRVPSLTNNTLRYSAEIRAGQRDRDDALRGVEAEGKAAGIPRELGYFMARLGLTEDEFRACVKDNMRHRRFQVDPLPKRLVLYLLERLGRFS